MSLGKRIKSFQKLITSDEMLTDKLRQTNNFEDLVALAQQCGYQITTLEFQEHAETIVRLKAQEAEELSFHQQNKSSSTGLFRSFLSKRKAPRKLWEYEMTRLSYYSPDASYDAFARFREKGG